MNRRIICALDTGDIDEALNLTKRLSAHVGAFKIGHALTLPHGLEVIERLYEAGAQRIFLDLKFHDIPNSVALAVREAARHKVWMVTLHIAGGSAMMTAAAEEARFYDDVDRPLLVGVSVLTSLDQQVLNDQLGVDRTIPDHMCQLSSLALNCGLDGVVSSPEEVAIIRQSLGHDGVIVTPGIRFSAGDAHDQVRVGTPEQAIADGANYLVIGRALTSHPDPESVLASIPSGPAVSSI
jgi:orotidine-5'-phosphate decarboxylase